MKMVLGKVMEVCSRPRIGAVSSIGVEQSQSRPAKNCDLVVLVCYVRRENWKIPACHATKCLCRTKVM